MGGIGGLHELTESRRVGSASFRKGICCKEQREYRGNTGTIIKLIFLKLQLRWSSKGISTQVTGCPSFPFKVKFQ